jgi:hypothetical protein
MRALPEVVEVRPYLLQSAQSTKFSGAYRIEGRLESGCGCGRETTDWW